jgi:hypothetical protein
LKGQDRLFWVVLKPAWPNRRHALIICQPETATAWQRAGFSGSLGLTVVDQARTPELVQLTRGMWEANPSWGGPRIRDEAAELELQASTATIRKYRLKSGRRPSQGWQTFLRTHAGTIAALDFFVVPRMTCRLPNGFVVLTHGRRKVVLFRITQAPTAEWTAQQVINAFSLRHRAQGSIARSRFN